MPAGISSNSLANVGKFLLDLYIERGRTSYVEGTDLAFTWFWLRSFRNLRSQLYVSACLTSLAIVLPAAQKIYLRHVVIVM